MDKLKHLLREILGALLITFKIVGGLSLIAILAIIYTVITFENDYYTHCVDLYNQGTVESKIEVSEYVQEHPQSFTFLGKKKRAEIEKMVEDCNKEYDKYKQGKLSRYNQLKKQIKVSEKDKITGAELIEHISTNKIHADDIIYATILKDKDNVLSASFSIVVFSSACLVPETAEMRINDTAYKTKLSYKQITRISSEYMFPHCRETIIVPIQQFEDENILSNVLKTKEMIVRVSGFYGENKTRDLTSSELSKIKAVFEFYQLLEWFKKHNVKI